VTATEQRSSPGLRLLPLEVLGARGARHMIERNLRVYRKAWQILVSGAVEPFLYLFAIGLGLGRLVGDVGVGDAAAVDYASFVAPGLLAASAMNGAVYESTFNIFFKLRYGKIYDAVLATPMQPRDIAVGEIAFSQLRGLLYAISFFGVMVLLGLVTSPWGVLAIPGAMLIGFAFGAVGMVLTTYMRSWQHFDLVMLATLPMFLLSATFFPPEVYPPAVRPLLVLSPLYHGAALLRGLTLGIIDASLLGHAAFLGVMAVIGFGLAARRLHRLLLT
jgi:lipooligosaccharide transport system permease protein